MKLYIYDKNIKYNKDLSEFIKMSSNDREGFLKSYKSSEHEVEVNLFASGSTCLCYKVVGNDKSKAIYKQFCPLSFEEKGYIVRRDNAVYIHDEVEIDFIKEQYDNFLRQTFNNVISIGEAYNIDEINMFIRPEIVLTNLGYMFCAEITGETLKVSYDNLLFSLKESKDTRKFLSEVLYKIFRTLQTVKVAHESDTLILDLKGENLIDVTGDVDQEKVFVRLIDFGSCINIEDMAKLIEKDNAENFLEKYIYSNEKYYDTNEVKNIVKNIANSKDDYKESTKSLDITAVKKIFCDLLKCAKEGFSNIEKNKKAIKTDEMEGILTDFFLEFSYSISNNLFEQFNLYCLLKEFLNLENIYDILQIVANILSILGLRAGNHSTVFWPFKIKGGDEEDVVEQQKRTLLNNKTFAENRKHLISRGVNFDSLLKMCTIEHLNNSVDVYEYVSTQGKKIDKYRLADIEINGNRIKYDFERNKSQLSQIVEKENNFPLLIDGEGGRGKSTALINLVIEKIKSNSKVFHKLDLKFLSSSVDHIYPIHSLYQANYGYNLDDAVSENFILMLDGLNEAEQHFILIKQDFINELLNLISAGCKIILTMRNRQLLDRDVLKKFICCEIQELSSEQVKKIVKVYDNSFAPLLKNNYNLNMFETITSMIGKNINIDEIELEHIYHNYCIKARYIANKIGCSEKEVVDWLKYLEGDCAGDVSSEKWKNFFTKNILNVSFVDSWKNVNIVYSEITDKINDNTGMELTSIYQEIYHATGIVEQIDEKWYFTHDRIRDYFQYLFYKDKIYKTTKENYSQGFNDVIKYIVSLKDEDAIKAIRILTDLKLIVKKYGDIEDDFTVCYHFVRFLKVIRRENAKTLGYANVFRYVDDNKIIEKFGEKADYFIVVKFLMEYAESIWRNKDGDTEKALELNKMALQYLSGSEPEFASICCNIGCILDRLKRREEALVYYNNAICLLKKIVAQSSEVKNEISLLSKAYNNIAQHFWEQRGNKEEAIKYYKKSLALRKALYEKEKDIYNLKLLLKGFLNLAIIFIWDTKKTDRVLINQGQEYINQALELIQSIRDKDCSYQTEYYEAKFYKNMGLSYEILEEYEMAKEFYFQALILRERIFSNEPSSNRADIACSYHDYYRILRLIFNESGQDLENRLFYLKKSYDLTKELYDLSHSVYFDHMLKIGNDLLLEYDELIQMGENKDEYEKEKAKICAFLFKVRSLI